VCPPVSQYKLLSHNFSTTDSCAIALGKVKILSSSLPAVSRFVNNYSKGVKHNFFCSILNVFNLFGCIREYKPLFEHLCFKEFVIDMSIIPVLQACWTFFCYVRWNERAQNLPGRGWHRVFLILKEETAGVNSAISVKALSTKYQSLVVYVGSGRHLKRTF
jgi:hypothetical protein